MPEGLREARLKRLLNESPSDDKSLDLSISDNGRRGTFTIGDDQFPASLFDLPCIVESHKTYDDSVLIKTADVGQVCKTVLCCVLYLLVLSFCRLFRSLNFYDMLIEDVMSVVMSRMFSGYQDA
nr:transcription initiation factor TFIID subunit 7 [Tanacetum cinerariifolium]